MLKEFLNESQKNDTALLAHAKRLTVFVSGVTFSIYIVYEHVSHVSFFHPRSKNQSSIFIFRTDIFFCLYTNVSTVPSEFSCLVSNYRKTVLILRILFVCLFVCLIKNVSFFVIVYMYIFSGLLPIQQSRYLSHSKKLHVCMCKLA